MIKNHFLILSLVLSIGLCIYGLTVFYYKDYLTNPVFAFLSTIFWLSSILTWGFYSFKFKKGKVDHSEILNKREYILFFLIIILAFILRILWLGKYATFYDDWLWLDHVRKMLSGKALTPFGFIGDQPSNFPAFLVLPIYFLSKNYLAVRFTGILLSIGNLIIVFYLSKKFFNKKIAFFTIFLIATSIWDIHVSKIPWINTTINPILMSGSIYFFYQAITKFSFRNSYIAGIFMGLSINLLYLAAVNVLALIIFAFIKLLTTENKRRLLLRFALVIFVTFLVSAPTFVKIIKYPDISISRHEKLIYSNLQISKKNRGINYYLDQAKITASRFLANYQDYKNHVFPYWGITIEPIIQILFLIGLIYTMFHLKNDRNQILLLTFIFMFLPLVILERGASEWREYAFFNYIYLFSGIGVWLIFSFLRLIISKNTTYAVTILSIILYLFLFNTNLNTYYKNNIVTEKYYYEDQCREIAEYILKNVKPGKTIYLQDEICSNLIATRIWDNYTYSNYSSLADLQNLPPNRRGTVIVKLGLNYNSQSNVLGDIDIRPYLNSLGYKENVLPKSQSLIFQQ